MIKKKNKINLKKLSINHKLNTFSMSIQAGKNTSKRFHINIYY